MDTASGALTMLKEDVNMDTGLDTVNAVCPRCGDNFTKQYFVICGGCLGDLTRAQRGLATTHFVPFSKPKTQIIK